MSLMKRAPACSSLTFVSLLGPHFTLHLSFSKATQQSHFGNKKYLIRLMNFLSPLLGIRLVKSWRPKNNRFFITECLGMHRLCCRGGPHKAGCSGQFYLASLGRPGIFGRDNSCLQWNHRNQNANEITSTPVKAFGGFLSELLTYGALTKSAPLPLSASVWEEREDPVTSTASSSRGHERPLIFL